jgi:hypothetical protein
MVKWDFVALSEDHKFISYKPKYKEIYCWDALIAYLKDPAKRLKGLEMEDGIELETYWEINEDCKKRLAEDSCPIREIEIKGTDKKVLYYIGKKIDNLFTKVEFLSRCDKVINTSKRFL